MIGDKCTAGRELFFFCAQGTEAEQRVHSEESMNHHLEMSVEHTAQTELDVVRLRGQTAVTAACCGT